MKLLPCPFCGSEARMIERKCSPAKYGIGCSNMDCIIWLPEDAPKRNLQSYVTCYVKKEDCIERWNRRHTVNGRQYDKCQ
jgi:hypothetical protein